MFQFLDASSQPDDYENPIQYNINSDHILQVNMNTQKQINFHMGVYEVQQKFGWFWKTTSTVQSIGLINSFKDETHRKPKAAIESFEGEDGNIVNKVAPYVTLVFQASNQKITVEREYETLLDAGGNIGGLAEALGFVILMIICCHTDVSYHQRILNDGLHMGRDEIEEDEYNKLKEEEKLLKKNKMLKSKKDKNGNKLAIIPHDGEKSIDGALESGETRKHIDEENGAKKVSYVETDQFGRKQTVTKFYKIDKQKRKYTYCEIFRFRFLCGCCIKKHKERSENFERDLGTVHNIIDIKTMIKNGGNLNVLQNVMLKDYQIKLIPHIQKKEKIDENEKALKLTNQEALDTLKRLKEVSDKVVPGKPVNPILQKKMENLGISEYSKKIDEYILNHLNEEFLDIYGGEVKKEVILEDVNQNEEVGLVNRAKFRNSSQNHSKHDGDQGPEVENLRLKPGKPKRKRRKSKSRSRSKNRMKIKKSHGSQDSEGDNDKKLPRI